MSWPESGPDRPLGPAGDDTGPTDAETEQIRAALARLPRPVLPPAVAARLDAALADEPPLPGGRFRSVPRPGPALAAAAAAVVVLAGAALLIRIAGPTATPTGSAASNAELGSLTASARLPEPGRARSDAHSGGGPEVQSVPSPRDYRPDQLDAEVRTLLASAPLALIAPSASTAPPAAAATAGSGDRSASPSAPTGASTGPVPATPAPGPVQPADTPTAAAPSPLLAVPAGMDLAGCLARLGVAPARPIAVQPGRFRGSAALLLVIADRSDRGTVDALVVGPDCSASGGDLRYRRDGLRVR